MTRATTAFTNEQKANVAQAVASAEARTSAEIVPVVATASGRYDRAEDVAGLWCALFLLSLVWWLVPFKRPEEGSWEELPVVLEWICLVAGVCVGFVVGAVAASQFFWIRRLCTPTRQMAEEVQRRSREIFFDKRIHHTGRAEGVLLYVSLYERMALVLADRSVIEALGEADFEEISSELTTALRKHQTADALCHAITEMGQRLESRLPRRPDDVNELADALVTID